jgi:hypothetical protein
MAASIDFKQEQRGVAIRMAAALCVTILVAAAWLYWGVSTSRPLPDRLMLTAAADVFVVGWLAMAIGNVARLRFFSVTDIAGSGSPVATADVGRANALLQNTLEQVVLAIPVHVALAILIASSATLILALAALFGIGRLLFWIGYAGGARSRAFGFALTFYPSVCGLVIAAVSVAQLSL